MHCENQEENFVKSFNEKFRLEQEEWGNKITALERDIEQENYRNTEEKMKLCSEIDVCSIHLTKSGALRFFFLISFTNRSLRCLHQQCRFIGKRFPKR